MSDRIEQIRERLKAVEAGPRPHTRTGLIEDVQFLLDCRDALEQERDRLRARVHLLEGERTETEALIVERRAERNALDSENAQLRAALEQERNRLRAAIIEAKRINALAPSEVWAVLHAALGGDDE